MHTVPSKQRCGHHDASIHCMLSVDPLHALTCMSLTPWSTPCLGPYTACVSLTTCSVHSTTSHTRTYVYVCVCVCARRGHSAISSTRTS